MKKLIFTMMGITLLALSAGCDDGSVTTKEVTDACSNISGTYSGSYTDNSCNGGHTSDTISNFTITNGCDAEIKGFIVSAKGSITDIDKDGNSFNVRVETPPGSTCGGLTGRCLKKTGTSQTYDCTYNWDKGGSGEITVKKH